MSCSTKVWRLSTQVSTGFVIDLATRKTNAMANRTVLNVIVIVMSRENFCEFTRTVSISAMAL